MTLGRSLTECRLLVLVGLTGVGKTTTVAALRALGLDFELLPNRRQLTDEHMIGWLQDQDGVPRAPVVDRGERFEMTRRYREIHGGGMAHVLAGLRVHAELGAGESGEAPVDAAVWQVFDGLRGANEVSAAARELPRARFLALTAPAGVRLLRLLGRGDSFDRLAATGAAEPAHETIEPGDPELGILEPEFRLKIARLMSSGTVDPEELRAKLSILAREHESYSQEETIAALRATARDRLIEAKTELESPEQIAERVCALLSPSESTSW